MLLLTPFFISGSEQLPHDVSRQRRTPGAKKLGQKMELAKLKDHVPGLSQGIVPPDIMRLQMQFASQRVIAVESLQWSTELADLGCYRTACKALIRRYEVTNVECDNLPVTRLPLERAVGPKKPLFRECDIPSLGWLGTVAECAVPQVTETMICIS